MEVSHWGALVVVPLAEDSKGSSEDGHFVLVGIYIGLYPLMYSVYESSEEMMYMLRCFQSLSHLLMVGLIIIR
jgi:hypothetical protein